MSSQSLSRSTGARAGRTDGRTLRALRQTGIIAALLSQTIFCIEDCVAKPDSALDSFRCSDVITTACRRQTVEVGKRRWRLSWVTTRRVAEIVTTATESKWERERKKLACRREAGVLVSLDSASVNFVIWLYFLSDIRSTVGLTATRQQQTFNQCQPSQIESLVLHRLYL